MSITSSPDHSGEFSEEQALQELGQKYRKTAAKTVRCDDAGSAYAGYLYSPEDLEALATGDVRFLLEFADHQVRFLVESQTKKASIQLEGPTAESLFRSLSVQAKRALICRAGVRSDLQEALLQKWQ